MPLCISHVRDETPRFLQYMSCNECAGVKEYGDRTNRSRKAAATKEHRGTGRVHSPGQQFTRAPSWHWPSHDQMLAQEEFWARVHGLLMARDVRHGA